jgi:hypothetical protein
MVNRVLAVNSCEASRKHVIDVLMAGIFCACVATLISTLWVVLFLVVPAHAVHDLARKTGQVLLLVQEPVLR